MSLMRFHSAAERPTVFFHSFYLLRPLDWLIANDLDRMKVFKLSQAILQIEIKCRYSVCGQCTGEWCSGAIL